MMVQPGIKSEATRAEYTVAGDFCRIFSENTNGLYWLSFLLTGDSAKAEQCFVSGLEDCLDANRVFRDWAESWARRTIIQNAIRVMQPAPERAAVTSAWMSGSVVGEHGDQKVPLADLLRLKTFERFVFVMSVLERYSDQECKTLLGCSRHDIVMARSQALKQMAASDNGSISEVARDAGKLFVQPRFMAETA
jgi:hypothetical protein